MAKASKEVTAETIKNCFANCGFTEETSEIEDDIADEEFNALFKELADSDCETTVEEYIDFDVGTCSLAPPINSDAVFWGSGSLVPLMFRVCSVQKCVTEYLRKKSGKDDIEVVSSDDDEDDVDVGNAMVEAEIHEITTCKALILLDKLVNLTGLNKDERASLSSIKDRLEIIRVKNKKQRPIKDDFFQ